MRPCRFFRTPILPPLPGVSWAFPDTRNARATPVVTGTNGKGRDMADRTKITTARARAFTPADGREAVLWDSLAPGFGLRVRPNGRKTWTAPGYGKPNLSRSSGTPTA